MWLRTNNLERVLAMGNVKGRRYESRTGELTSDARCSFDTRELEICAGLMLDYLRRQPWCIAMGREEQGDF
jgi:hypothetical protein